MSGQLNFDRQDYDITQTAESGILFAVHSSWRSGQKFHATKKHSFVALSCVLFILVLFAGSNSTFAQKCDIDDPIDIAQKGAAELRTEIKNRVRKKDYEAAWTKSQKLMRAYASHWDQQYDVLNLMAQIALADPDVKENGKARLRLAIDILKQFSERLRNMQGGNIGPEVHYASIAESSFMLVQLAAVCGGQNTVADLLDKVYGFAWRGDFSEGEEGIERRKKFLDRLVHYLAVFGKPEKAMNLLRRHWRFLEGVETNSVHAVRGMALLRVGEILEEEGNVPIAATFFVRAVDRFEKAGENVENKTSRVEKAKDTAKAKVKEYGLWAHLEKEKVTYEDRKTLKQRFQQLANKLAKAWGNQSIEEALKVIVDTKVQRKRLEKVYTLTDFKSVKLSIRSVDAVKTTEKRVLVSCDITAQTKDGKEVSGSSPLIFVRDNGTWKILFLPHKVEGTED